MTPRDWSHYDETWVEHWNAYQQECIAKAKARLTGKHEPHASETSCDPRHTPLTAMVEAMGGDDAPDMLVQLLNIRLLPEWVRS